MATNEVKQRAVQQGGISSTTLQRAKTLLGVAWRRTGGGAGTQIVCFLPAVSEMRRRLQNAGRADLAEMLFSTPGGPVTAPAPPDADSPEPAPADGPGRGLVFADLDSLFN